jgi:hypothetical protein
VSSVIAVILLLTFVKIRKEKRLNEAKNEKFISSEKGFLDHRADFDKAIKEFPTCIGGVGNEMGRISKTVQKAKFEVWSKINTNWGRKSASRTAAKLSKHTKAMERYSMELVGITKVLNESGFFLLKSIGNDTEKLNTVRQAYEILLDKTRISYDAISVFRDSQHSAKGVSQDMDTTLNHMIFVTEGVLETLQQCEAHWERFIITIDEMKSDS